MLVRHEGINVCQHGSVRKYIFSDNFLMISSEKPVTVRLEKCDILRGSFADALRLQILVNLAGVKKAGRKHNCLDHSFPSV